MDSYRNGWVTAFSDAFEECSEESLIALAKSLSARLGCPAVGFSVMRSDYLTLWVFDKSGRIVYRREVQSSDENCTGTTDDLVSSLNLSINPDRISQIVDGKYIFADFQLQDLASAFGIVHAGLSYQMLCSEIAELDDDQLPGVEDFLHVNAPANA